MTTHCMRGAVVDRYCLSKPGASKETWHLVIGMIDGPLSFRPGDSVGIWPRNSQAAVREMAQLFHLSSSEMVVHPRTGSLMPMTSFLTEAVDLNVVTPELVLRSSCSAHSESDRQALSEVLAASLPLCGYDVPGFLRRYMPHGADLHSLIDGFRPMRPRLYSISSGPSAGGHRIDLTVAKVSYPGEHHLRHGLCSQYLTEEVPIGEPVLTLLYQPSPHFSFPADPQVPVIMIGSGTGVAPFRSFMQEVEVGAARPSACWMFFGGRKRSVDFLYEDFWNTHVESGRLRLDTAFSQDQEHKIYVQHRMWEQKNELWQWLNDGAILFVCGDAKTMAKDVDGCLGRIIASEGSLSEEAALSLLRALHREKRYLRDVY